MEDIYTRHIGDVTYENGKRLVWFSNWVSGHRTTIETTGDDKFHDWIIRQVQLFGKDSFNGNTGWKCKYNKKNGRKLDGIKATGGDLTYYQYLKLASDVDINLDQIGTAGDSKQNYQLCRINHDLPYTDGNCFFGTQYDNQKERLERCGNPNDNGYGFKQYNSTMKTCECCGKTVNMPSYNRYHGDKCGKVKGWTHVQKKKTCEHCGIITNIPNYAKHHGDKCKNKINRTLFNINVS